MIIFFYGSDAYRLKEGRGEVVAKYKEKYPSGLNHTVHDLGQFQELDSVQDAIKNQSFFHEVKLILIRNTFSNASTTEKIQSLISQYNLIKEKEVVLFIEENKTKGEMEKVSKSLFSVLASQSKPVKEYEPLKGKAAEQWILSECKKREIKIKASVAFDLLQRIGNDSWKISLALDQIANYAGSKEISQADLNLFAVETQEATVFAFLDAFSTKSNALAVTHLFKGLASGQDPYYLLSMLAYQLRTMLMAKDALERKWPASSAASKLGLHPFVARKTMASVAKHSKEELLGAYNQIQQMDILSKQGKVDLEDSLFSFVLSFTK